MIHPKETIIKEKRSALSIYQQIEAQLRACIQSGQWVKGEMIPTRRELAIQYAVNGKTIQRALEPMLADGTLQADSRRGTYVAQKPLLKNTPMSAQMSGQTAYTALNHTTVVGIITLMGDDESRPESGCYSRTKVIITNSLERAVSEAGATSHVFNRFRADKPPYTIEEAIEMLQADGVDGIVFQFVTDAQEMVSAFSLASEKQIPAVFVSTEEITLTVPVVFCGDRDAGYQATNHLLQRGCRDLLFFAPYSADWVEMRLAGAQEAVFFKGLPPQTLQVFIDPVNARDLHAVYGDAATHDGLAYQTAQTLLAKGLPAEGIIAANDLCAVGFYHAATEAGYVAGRDYALLGFDDLVEAQQFGITSLHPPLERLGQEAIRVITRAMSDGYVTNRTSLNFNVVARRSTQFQKRLPTAPIQVSI